jgi:hypothetical protein
MGLRSTVQLPRIKDKVSKRYMIRYSFYRKDQPLFDQWVDIHDLVKERGWKSISYAESMEISMMYFGLTFGKYCLISELDEKGESWTIYQVDGFSVGLSQEDLATIRNMRIESLGIV